MTTIVEPKEYVVKLWGKQQVCKDATYRLMRYILRVDHEGKILLHNVVTGQLVVLSNDEAAILEEIPMTYHPVIKQLVTEHYLVPEKYDEHLQVRNLKAILRMLEDSKGKQPIQLYTILLTTACNARCYYCYEHGIRNVTMTEQTADDVVNFISSHCSIEKPVYITWFGGEPTVAANRIDQICKGLQNNQIEYHSDIATNGYLFDEELAEKAKHLWHVVSAQICVDGMEESYNKIKAFVNPSESPYKRVMRNVGLLLERGIRVGLRMNFDIANHQEFKLIVDEAIKRFNCNPLLHVNAFPVIGEYADHDGHLLHGDDSWLETKFVELNEYARNAGVAHNGYKLPSIQYIGCDGDNPAAITIMPDGALIRCGEQFNDEDIGNVRDGITDVNWLESWKATGDYQRCIACPLYPRCVKLVRCKAKDRCYIKSERIRQYERALQFHYNEWNNHQKEGAEGNDL